MSLHLRSTRQHVLIISLPSTFPTILDETRIQAIETLDSWNFEPSKLPEEGVLVCTIILFEALLCREGMEDETNITLGTSLSHPYLPISGQTHLKSQLSSPPSYLTYVRSTDVRTRITTFVTLWMSFKPSMFSYILLESCLLYPH